MTGCSAPTCSNHSRNGFKFYRFPADLERRKIWLKNCRRANWTPTQNDRLCSAHFEDCQIEQNRADGKRRLLPFAVPTIFNISEPTLKALRRGRRKRLVREGKFNKFIIMKRLESDSASKDEVCFPLATSDQSSVFIPEWVLDYDVMDTATELPELRNRIVHLEEELQVQNEAIAKLKQELKVKNEALARFLTPAQIIQLRIKSRINK